AQRRRGFSLGSFQARTLPHPDWRPETCRSGDRRPSKRRSVYVRLHLISVFAQCLTRRVGAASENQLNRKFRPKRKNRKYRKKRLNRKKRKFRLNRKYRKNRPKRL